MTAFEKKIKSDFEKIQTHHNHDEVRLHFFSVLRHLSSHVIMSRVGGDFLARRILDETQALAFDFGKKLEVIFNKFSEHFEFSQK